MDKQQRQDILENGFPFHSMLGVKVDDIDDGRVRLHIPYKEELVGHAESAMMHGGVISTLVDISGGFAIWTLCKPEDHIVTITLTVDYLRPAIASDLYAEATVRLLGHRVGNAHVVVWSGSNPEKPVAEGRGVYNIRRKKSPK